MNLHDLAVTNRRDLVHRFQEKENGENLHPNKTISVNLLALAQILIVKADGQIVRTTPVTT